MVEAGRRIIYKRELMYFSGYTHRTECLAALRLCLTKQGAICGHKDTGSYQFCLFRSELSHEFLLKCGLMPIWKCAHVVLPSHEAGCLLWSYISLRLTVNELLAVTTLMNELELRLTSILMEISHRSVCALQTSRSSVRSLNTYGYWLASLLRIHNLNHVTASDSA